jgi:hypothetical protein
MLQQIAQERLSLVLTYLDKGLLQSVQVVLGKKLVAAQTMDDQIIEMTAQDRPWPSSCTAPVILFVFAQTSTFYCWESTPQRPSQCLITS